MGTPAGRIFDMCSGHDCHCPRPAIEGSENVFVNGRRVLRLGDTFTIHCCGEECHYGYLSQGSTTVTANGKGIGYIGCGVTCGSVLQTGSDNVLIG